MAWACLAIIVSLPVAQVAYWATVSSADLAVQGNLPALAIQQPLQTWQRWAGGLVMGIPLAMMLTAVWQARRCFLRLSAGQVFTPQVAGDLRSVAAWVAAAALAAMVSGAITSVLLTFNNAPGTRQLSIAMSSNHIFTLFFAALVWLMADIIARGQALAEENDRFV